jgi:transglutaminase-like putative cysteine protease
VKVGVVHTTRLEYSENVAEGVTEARLGPRSDADQHWLGFDLRTSPPAAVNQFVDGFGNVTHLITLAVPHPHLEIVARSTVDTLLEDPFSTPASPQTELTASEHADYLTPSPLVPVTEDLEFLAAQFKPGGPVETFDTVRSLMEFIYREFEYAPQVTTVATTVPEVLAHRRGVCQDFTHVLIGMCRALGIAARYVSGYVVVEPGRATRGNEASHAWVEAFTPTHGWRGFDPTNNLLASEYHIKMAVGRDYRDVAPTRGTYRGRAAEALTVAVETRIQS